MKLLSFLKTKWRITLIIAGTLFFILWFSIKQHQVKVLTEKITTLEISNFALDNDRVKLEFINKKYISDNLTITVRNDSLKKVLAKYQLQLSEMKKTHERELAELAKIPNDTVFVRLQPLFPNFDSSPLKYPFSGSQISRIYKMQIECGQQAQEYSVQGHSLATCMTLNNGFEKSISNLNSQIGNLKDILSGCDTQKANDKKTVDLLNKQVKNKTFWNRTLLGATIVTTLLFVIK